LADASQHVYKLGWLSNAKLESEAGFIKRIWTTRNLVFVKNAIFEILITDTGLLPHFLQLMQG